MGEIYDGPGGTKFYNPEKAFPILGMACDGHQIFLTGGGGGSTAAKEVPNLVQAHRVDEVTGKVSTVATLNTEKGVVIHLSSVPTTRFWLACLQARCKVLQLGEDGGSLTEVSEWTCEEYGRKPEINVARAAPTGELLATGGTDGQVRIWRFTRVRDAPVLQRACQKTGEVADLDFSPDGTTIISCSTSGPCRLWDAVSGEEKISLQYARSGKSLVVKAVRFVMHADRGVPILVLAANSGPRDPSYIGLFGTDGNKIGEAKVDKGPLTGMGVDVSGQWVAVTLVSGGKKVYSLPDLRLLKAVNGLHDLPAPSVAIVGQVALSGGGDRTINMMSFARGGGSGASSFLYMCLLLIVLLAVAYLTVRIGLKGAALQQGSRADL